MLSLKARRCKASLSVREYLLHNIFFSENLFRSRRRRVDSSLRSSDGMLGFMFFRSHRLFDSSTSTHRLFDSSTSTHRLFDSSTSTHRLFAATFRLLYTSAFCRLRSADSRDSRRSAYLSRGFRERTASTLRCDPRGLRSAMVALRVVCACSMHVVCTQ